MPTLLLLLVALVWGSTFVVIKGAIQGVDPFLLVFSRLALAALGLFPWAWARQGAALFERRAMAFGALLGLLLCTTYATQTLGLRWTTTGHSGFITGSAVILVPLLGWLLFRTRPGAPDLLACLAVVLGLYLLVYRPGMPANRGDAITALTAGSYACHLLVAGRAVRRASALAVIAWQFLFASLFGLAAFLAFGGPSAEPWRPALLPIAYLGAVGTLFCYFVSVWAQQHVRPVTVVLVFSLESVFAAAFGWLVRGETLGTLELGGAALIFGGALGHGLWTTRARASARGRNLPESLS